MENFEICFFMVDKGAVMWGNYFGNYVCCNNGYARNVLFSSRDENVGYALPH